MKMLNFIAKEGWGVWMTTHTLQKEIKVAGLKRTVTTTILPASAARLIMALSDVILYIDIKENGQRVLVVQPEDTMEVGDRTHALQENIVFTHPKQGYDLMMSKFNVKESATNG
jgi:ABC-type Fe3+ transport system substrate-binding protein